MIAGSVRLYSTCAYTLFEHPLLAWVAARLNTQALSPIGGWPI